MARGKPASDKRTERAKSAKSAPQPRKAAAKGVKKDTRILKSSKDGVPSEPDPFKGTPQAHCTSCDQKTSTVDRQSPKTKPKWLHWVQKKNEGKLMLPVGHECYKCYKVRRTLNQHSQKKDRSQEELNESRKACKTLDDKFWQLRADDVGEVHDPELKKEHPDVDAIIESTEHSCSYRKRFVIGMFEHIFEFASDRRLSWETPEELVELIAEKNP